MRINLLPWREARRNQCKRAFAGALALAACIGLAIVIIVMVYGADSLEAEASRNALLKEENAQLDSRIKEIAGLSEEIKLLKARQSAVENLQARRNYSVYMLDELASLVPAGVVLKSIKQTDTVLLTGYAQSNARVSEFLRSLGSKAQWLARPELIEVKSAVYGAGKDARKIVEFSIRVDLKHQQPERA